MKLPIFTKKMGGVSMRLLLLGIALAFIPLVLVAQAPQWWTDRGVQNGNPANDYAAVNQGQLKNIATRAVAELNEKLPGAPLGAGAALNQLVVTLSSTSARTNDYAAVNLGQLKTTAKPLFDKLLDVGYHGHPLESGTYPWVGHSANDYAMANIGQVKNLFSFDVTVDGDVPPNGLPDWWERHWFNGQTGINRNALAPRGDGLTNLQSYFLGLNPLDQYNSVVNPVKPTISLTASPSIATVPATITLTATAAEVSGTIARVDFYQDSGYFGSVSPSSSGTSFTCTAQLSNLAAGNYQMSAIAVDAAGISSTSTSVNVTINPAPAVIDLNRYNRGWGTDQNYYSSVIALDLQKGTYTDGTNNNFASVSGLPWCFRTQTEPNSLWTHILSGSSGITYAPFDALVTVSGSTVGGAPPLAAFGSQYGGTPLYTNQYYNFGVLAGGPCTGGTNDIMIEVYEKSAFDNNAVNRPPITSGTYYLTLPKPGTAAWTTFAQNGYVTNFPPISRTFNGNTVYLDTRVQYVPGDKNDPNGSATWGQKASWPLLVSHKSSSPDFFFKVSYMGNYDSTHPMAKDTNGQQTYNLTYSLDFDQPASWQSTYFSQPHFQGSPLPSAYQGKSLDELIHNAPAVSGSLSTPTGSTLTTVDNSPELRSHPVLDKFVTDMGSDPMTLANYVLNEIDLTDAIGYNATGQTSDASINPTGVSRNALATFLEGQGSPTEQCALLVYLLRKTNTPCCYVFPQQNGTLMFDEQLSKLLRMQLRGAKDYLANPSLLRLIPVNYPWVAAYIGGKWVHIFPWLKDTAVEENYDLWDYMPTGYQTGSQWLRHYLLDDPNIRSLSTEADNPGVLFPLWVNKQLKTSYAGMSMDDLGISIYNRRNYYTKWEDFPRPWQTPTISDANLAQSLTVAQDPQLNTSLQNIFDTVIVKLFKDPGNGSTQGQTPIITTGTMRLVELHDRRFLLYHEAVNRGASYNVRLSLEAFRPLATGTNNFTNGPGDLLNKQTASYSLSSADDALLLQISYQRHQQFSLRYSQPDFWTPFLGFYESLTVDDTRPLRKGDMAAICLNYGRVSQKMQEFQAEKYWNYQQQVAKITPPPATVDPEKSTGEILYLMGLSYYYKVNQFQQKVEGWTKTHATTWNAHGLAKLSPPRTSGTVGLTSSGDIDLRYPNVDMLFLKVAWAGNGTSHLDSGDEGEAGHDAMQLMIGETSAEEHRVINQFFQQDAAVSTVKLLDLAQGSTPGSGVIELNAANYVQEGQKSYTVDGTPKTLMAWAGGTNAGTMWSTITAKLTDPNYGQFTTIFITPGPVTAAAQQGQPYKGMGAFIIGVGDYEALISGNLNGGFGGYIGFSIYSYTPPPSFLQTTFVLPTIDYGYTVASTYYATPSAPIYTPPVYSASSYSTINTAISTSSMAVFPDVSVTLSNFAYNTGYSSSSSYTVPYTGYETAAINTAYSNIGYAGQSTDNRNLTFSMGATSNGSYASASGVADPVNVVTGEFYVDSVDLKLNGPMPLEIRRNYGSLNKADNNFGQGWRMSYFPYLVFSSTDSTVSPQLITAAEADGSVITYRRQTSPNTLWIPTPGDNPSLANVAQGIAGGLGNVYNNQLVLSGTDTFILTGADGSVRTFRVQSFDQDGSGLNRKRPYLQSWNDNRGNSYSFTFGNDPNATDYAKVNRIQSSNGTFAGFYYDTYGHITEAYTNDGRRLYYNYDNYGDLIQVTLPDASTVQYAYQHLPVVGTGLNGDYFNDTSLTNRVLTRTDATVNFDWANSPGSPVLADNFSVRWTGLVQPVYSETYTFYVTGDDGIKLWVNGKLLCDGWKDQGPTEYSGTIALVAGQKYDIQIAYYEHTGGATAKLMWSSAHQAKQIIPKEQLFPTLNPASNYSSHLLTQETKPGGRVLQNDYDSTGRVTVQRSTVGGDLTPVLSGSFAYVTGTNADSTVSGTTTFTNYVSGTLSYATKYTYANGQIVRVDDPSGYPVIQEWYQPGDNSPGAYPRSLKRRTDKRGLLTTYTYDARGNPVQTSITGDLNGDPNVSGTTATTYTGYNSLNLVTSSTNAIGNVTNYVYGISPGRLYLPTSIENRSPQGVVSTTILDYEDVGTGMPKAFGVLKTQRVAAGTPDEAETDYSHNANGFITSITRPTRTSDPAEVINYSYNLRGEMTSETDALGRTTNYAYDGRGNRIWTERHDETGTLVSWQYNYYNQNGEIEWTQGPRYSPDDYVLTGYDGAGRLSEQTKWRSEANSSNNGVQAPQNNDAAYATAFYLHDRAGNVTEARDLRHNSTEMGYDGIGQMTSRKFHDGDLLGPVKAQESFSYEPGGQVSTYVSPISGTTTKLYTSTGKLKEQHNPDGSILYWQYDASGRVVKEFLSNHNYWETSYNDYTRIVTRTLKKAAGTALKSESSSFDRRGNLISKTDMEGNTFSSVYDALNRIKATAGPATNATTAQESTYHTYGAGGKVHIVSDALMQNTYTLSDTLGRPLLVQVKDKQNNVVRQTSYVYSPDFNSVTITQGIGTEAISTTTFTDTFGKPVLVQNGDGTFKRFDYDNAGNLLKSRDEDGNVTVTSYDALNRPKTQTLPGGAATSFEYDPAGNVLQRQMPGNQVLWQSFDSASRKTSEYLAGTGGNTTRTFIYTYYPAGNDWVGLPATTTDSRGVQFVTTYDDLKRPAVVTASGSQPEQNQITTYGFDWLGHMTSVEQHYTYGGGFTSGTATLVQRTYDGYGHIKTEQVSIDGVPMNQFSQSWDGAGNRTSLASNLTPQGNGAGLISAYNYRADGLLKQERVARGNGTTRLTNDNPSYIPGDPSDPSSHNFTFDSAGRPLSRQNPWRTQSVTYRDYRGRTLGLQNRLSDGSTPFSEWQDWAGRDKRSDYTAYRSGVNVWNETRNYSYNGRGQMYFESDAPAPNGYADFRYRFDFETLETDPPVGMGLGVRTMAARDLAPNDPNWETGSWLVGDYLYSDPCVDSFLRPTFEAQFTGVNYYWQLYNEYDGAGQMTWRDLPGENGQNFVWDAYGRLVVTTQADRATWSNGFDFTCIYDGLGRRLRTIEDDIYGGVMLSSQTIDSYYDPQVEFLELGVNIYNSSSATWTRTWKVYGPDLNGRYGGLQGIGGLEATIDESTSVVTPVVNDAFGNVVGTANGTMSWNPARVGSYGVLPDSTAPLLDGANVTVAQASVFRGHRIDPTGLYYMGARYYEPNSGRFISPDPLGHASSMNLYDYANGDPVNGIDPDGRCPFGNSSAGFNTTSASYPYSVQVAQVQMNNQILQDYMSAEPVNSRLRGVAGMVGSGLEVLGGIAALPAYGAGAPAVLHGWDSFTANAGQTVFGGQNESNFVAGTTWVAQKAGYSPQAASNIAEWADFGVGLAANGLSAAGMYKLGVFNPAEAGAAETTMTSSVAELRAAGLKDAHHVIQDAAVRDLPGYSSRSAPGVQLVGPSTAQGSPHYIATQVQRQAGGGTYAAERRIGYKALRQAGYSEIEGRQIISETDAYFQSIGVTPTTPTRIPGNRY